MQVTSEEDIKNAIATAKEKYGGVNAAVNCAGIGIAVLTYNKNKDRVHKLDEFQKVLNVSFEDVKYIHVGARVQYFSTEFQ